MRGDVGAPEPLIYLARWLQGGYQRHELHHAYLPRPGFPAGVEPRGALRVISSTADRPPHLPLVRLDPSSNADI